MTLSTRSERTLGTLGAAAWVTVPIAWGVATLLDRTQPWEDTPQRWFLLGWTALMAAGAMTTLVVGSSRGDRPRLRTAGVVTMILGVGVSAGIGWAVPIWTTVFGVGLALLAISARAEPSTWLMAGGFMAATATFFAIQALGLGTPDVHGDYPAAWTTATILAAAGASLGLLWRTAGIDSTIDDGVTIG